MANFLKPPGIDPKGYDAGLNKQAIAIAHYSTLGLWGGGPNGEKLTVALSDSSIGRIEERAKQGDLRVFRVTGSKVGAAKLEARTASGAVWASMLIEVTGAAATATKEIVVDLALQKVEALASGKRVFLFDCVSGDSSHPTTKGSFKILRKHHPYTSKKYGVKMDYAMFFTVDGKALHQYHGIVPLSVVRTFKSGSDFFGSHGCVRLTQENAHALYEWASIGTPVRVK